MRRQNTLEGSGKTLWESEPEPEPEPELPLKTEEEEEVGYREAFAGFRKAADIMDVGEIKVIRFLSKGTSGTVSQAEWRGIRFWIKMMNFALKRMDFALKMANFGRDGGRSKAVLLRGGRASAC